MGTRNGMILETSIDGKEKYIKQVFSMQQNMPICSIHIEHFPEVEGQGHKYFVMAATANPSRYFQFIGGPTFESMFAYYKDLDRQNCTELPGFFVTALSRAGDMNYTELRFFRKPSDARSKAFALLTGFGVYFGSLYFGSQTAGEQVTADTQDIHHAIAPLSIALSEFHLLSLYAKKLVVHNLLSHNVVYERESGVELRGLCPDCATGCIWVYGERELFRVCEVLVECACDVMSDVMSDVMCCNE